MLVKALGAFVVLVAGMGVAHAQDYATLVVPPALAAQALKTPGLDTAPPRVAAKLIDFTLAPISDPGYAPLSSQTGEAPDPFSPAVWRAGEMAITGPGAVADQHLHLAVSDHYAAPDGRPIAHPGDGQMQPGHSFNLDYSLGLPGAISFSTPGHDWSLTPHAGFGLSDNGGKTTAGAVLSIRDRAANALQDLGVHDGKAMEGRSRYYLFAATSGKAVGFNILRDSSGDWRRAGWTMDSASRLIGETQVGVGWRRGAMETSFGYVHSQYNTPLATPGGRDGRDDDRVAFSFAIHSR